MGDRPVEWWSAGALVNARLGEGYAFVATALGTIRHQGWAPRRRTPSKGCLYALPENRCVVDARRLAAALGDALPAPRVSPWFGYASLDPAQPGRNRRDRIRQGRPAELSPRPRQWPESPL